MTRASYRSDWIALVGITAALALVPLLLGGSGHYMRLASLTLIYMVYAVAFNVIFGHTRQLFLCVGALAGCAGYVSVVLTARYGFSPWATMPLGIACAALLGGLFSYVSVRRGLGIIFVGIVTLVFSMIFHQLVLGLRTFTNGETGIDTSALAPSLLASTPASYYAILVLLACSLLLYLLLLHSRAGTAFRAIADDELAAELAGIDVVFYKVLAATIGSTLLGAIGVVHAWYGGFISPSVYSLVSIDVVVLVSLLLGGMGTLPGPVLGAILFAVLDEIVRPLGRLNVMVYGMLMIVLVITFRRGLVDMFRRLLSSRTRRA
ncbi:MAG: branched-chain amino acid ABC transporter permease [Burkholderiaceae bacterium]|nr:branched-chain amino acid ABC transporter permease [Burkholderiaceae bacterium]